MIAEGLERRLACPFIVPAHDDARVAEAVRSEASMVLLDLEGLVAPDDKIAARAAAVRLLERGPAGRFGLRINRLTCRTGLEDLLALADLTRRPAAVIVPMLQDAAHLDVLRGALGANPVPIVPIIESTAGLAGASAIAASRGVSALLFGGGDLAAELRVGRDWEPLLFARSRTVIAAAEAGIVAVDFPFRPVDDAAGLEGECVRARSLGMRGKVAIDRSQVRTISAAFGPREQAEEAA